jgi:exodeoxyribonuclease V alpha subunit
MGEDTSHESHNSTARAQPDNTIKTTVVVSTIYAGVGGRSAIFTGQDQSGRWIRIKADHDRIHRLPLKGETWEITGEFRNHPQYGKQFYAEYGRPVKPVSTLLIRHLGTHPAFRKIGLGKGKLAELYDAFGDSLREILDDGDIASLTRIISPVVADKLVLQWKKTIRDSSVIFDLEELRIAPRDAAKIIRLWGEEAAAKLRNNPYRLLALMSFKKADMIAQLIDIAHDDPRRLVAAVEACEYYRLDSHKDTLVDDVDLVSALLRIFNTKDKTIARKAIQLALNDRAIEGDQEKGYQSLGCAFMERFITERLTAMLRSNDNNEQINLFGNHTSYGNKLIDGQIGFFEWNEGIRLNAKQRSAVHMAAVCPLSVVKGGAGVGKTTVLKAIHQVAVVMHQSVFQMALAGRAAQRMREATGHEAYTIVGFLNQLHNKKITMKTGDLVIIDEASMLDLFLVFRLLRALHDGVRLLFVGDPFQLPPIGPGLIFHVLVNSSLVPSTELVEVHRQAASTGIPQFARAVRDGLVPEFSEFEGLVAGVSFIECPRISIVNHIIEVIAALNGFKETQILGVVKDGVAGVHQINSLFHHLLTPHQPSLYGWDMAQSDPIIYTKNDYERELFNGSLGRLRTVFQQGLTSSNCSGDEATVRAIADFEGREIEITEDDLGNIELAYAITVHKAQGSQFRRVVIPVTRSRLLDRTLLYTALTRGIEQVVFLGDKQVFKEAVIAKPKASQRRVGFSIYESTRTS